MSLNYGLYYNLVWWGAPHPTCLEPGIDESNVATTPLWLQ